LARDLKKLSLCKENDARFEGLVYLGRNRPLVTLNEFMEIKSRISSNPLEIKQYILSDLQTKRKANGKEVITRPTFYRVAKQATLSQFSLDYSFSWFASNKISMPEDYSVEEARESLSTIFTFSDMKTPFGPDIRVVYDKLSKAKEWFSGYKVEVIDYYPRVLTQGKHIRSLLTSIPSDQQKEVQARLIFECQVVFIVECMDLLIDLLIHEKGRIQQAVNKSRAKVENHILKNIMFSMRNDLNDMYLKSSPDMKKIHALANPLVGEKTKARIELLRKQYGHYCLILQVLDDLTKGLTDGVIFHDVDVNKLFLLAKDKNSWKFLS